jgi:hypothetical protein
MFANAGPSAPAAPVAPAGPVVPTDSQIDPVQLHERFPTVWTSPTVGESGRLMVDILIFYHTFVFKL